MEAILMKKMFYLSLILMMFLYSMPASAKMKKLGQAGMSFLNIGGSARASAMADVFGFAKNDLSSVFLQSCRSCISRWNSVLSQFNKLDC
jgi:hypothetical protein